MKKNSNGILFLPNHPAEIDPCILLRVLWPNFKPKPVALESLFYKPLLHNFLEAAGGIPVPNFEDSNNSFKKKQIENSYQVIKRHLESGENILFYPSGGLKPQAEEIIGGSSGLHRLLQEMPNCNIVLIRTTGLWGSLFSKALTGKSPDIAESFFKGFIIILKNLIFFSPRRTVTVELQQDPFQLTKLKDRLEINHTLENWYNSPKPEPLKLVSYSIWKKEFPKVKVHSEEELLDLSSVSDEVIDRVKTEISELTQLRKEEIIPSLHLAQDLGLDSLDLSQLTLFLKDQYNLTTIHPTDLTTVGSVMAQAAGIIKSTIDDEDLQIHEGSWHDYTGRPSIELAPGNTLAEAFLNSCARMGKHSCAVDNRTKEINYQKFKRAALILSFAIKKYDSDRIGILLPASVGAYITIFATILAGKIPVMINWTLGPRNLRAIIESSKIKFTLTSWAFIDRLENIDLDSLDDQLIFLEDVKKKIKLPQYIRGIFLNLKNPNSILKSLKINNVKKDDLAVILFTSGSESFPKGVPLSHHNILSNQKSALSTVQFFRDDVLFGVLPPFHSFGFSVTGLLPILMGMRAVYYPNPTDGKRMGQMISQWKATLLCLAPTFLKNLMKYATSEHLSSVRLIVTGAEKTPSELFQKVNEMTHAILIEGYGITECSPILTINPVDGGKKGVGLPIPGVKLIIVDPENYHPLPPNKEGVILAQGPNIFNGYLSQAESNPFISLENARWYVTGDLGYFDEGYLVLSGRLKRFVKIGGEMVSLTAVEESLYQAAKHYKWNIKEEEISFAIKSYEEEGKKGELILFTPLSLTIEEVNKALRNEGMSNLIKISSVKQVEKIPILATGKIDYQSLIV